MENVIFKNGKVLSGGKLVKKDICVKKDGKITYKTMKGKEIDISGCYLTPSLFDMHTHVRCPGFEYKEDFEHVTKAAVNGGFTDICSMPNTDPVADNQTVIDYIKLEVERLKRCRIFPFGSLTKNLEGERLSRMGLMKDSGAIGVTDDGKCIKNTWIMIKAMEYANTFKLFIMDHAEDNHIFQNGCINEGKVSDYLGLAGIPEIAETIIIKRNVEISNYLSIPIHIAHVSTKHGAQIILNAKKRGVKITFDVTPHHLSWIDECCRTFNTNYKVNPPLRTENDRQFLISLIRDGLVDCITTDHAPHAGFEKEFPIDIAPFGISNLDTAFSLLYKTLTVEAKIPLEKWIDLITNKPRKLLNIKEYKLKEDEKANFTVFDPKKVWKVTPDSLESKGKNTPLIGTKLKGKVAYTVFDGAIVYPFK